MARISFDQYSSQTKKALEKAIARERAKRHYEEYLKLVNHGKWESARHLKVVCEKLEAVIRGDIKRLMLFMPPRHGKSMSVTEAFPSYYLGKYPDKRVMEVSYGDTLAKKFGKANRDKVEEFGHELFGISVSSVQASKNNWNVVYKDEDGNYIDSGGMLSVGVGAGITGEGADLLIIDDPVKNRQEAESEAYRKHVWEEWQSTISTRLHAGAAVIVILTRWHEDDLAGRLLNSEYGDVEDWDIVKLECVCDSENDPLGRNIGETLWPEHGYDEDWAIRTKNRVGSYAWSSLYQQTPTPSGGGMFKRSWWKYYKVIPNDLTDFIQSWDCTFKDKEEGDFVVGQVWARKGADRYLLDQVRARMTFTETVEAMRQLSYKWPQTNRKLVEDKANGTAVMDVLKKELPGIIPVEPFGGKIVRATATTAVAEAGNVYIPDPSIAGWIGDFVEEMSAFPTGSHDDQVDCYSQANAWFNTNTFDLFNLT